MPKRKNLVGQQFDELTVIEMLYNYQNKRHTYCKCIGIDGNEYIIRQDALVSGITHTIKGACSGGKFQDITNERFGKLTVLRTTDKRSKNGSVVWECQCDCGNITYQSSTNLKRKHVTSCGCAKDDYVNSVKLDIIGQKFGMLTVIEEYFSNDNKKRMMRCRCDCGNERICPVCELTTGNAFSCGCVINKSKGEQYIEKILKDNDILYIPQKRFKECKNIKPLPFDFYLPHNNTCIEYDGLQHFKSIDYFGGEEHFNTVKYNDLIKDKYCNEYGINLIRIPYTMSKDDIYKTIINLTSPATTTA